MRARERAPAFLLCIAFASSRCFFQPLSTLNHTPKYLKCLGSSLMGLPILPPMGSACSPSTCVTVPSSSTLFRGSHRGGCGSFSATCSSSPLLPIAIAPSFTRTTCSLASTFRFLPCSLAFVAGVAFAFITMYVHFSLFRYILLNEQKRSWHLIISCMSSAVVVAQMLSSINICSRNSAPRPS